MVAHIRGVVRKSILFTHTYHSPSSTIPTRATLLPNGGANSAQSALRACSLHMSNTDRLYSVSSAALRVNALGFEHEHSVEANVRPASSFRNATVKLG